MCGIFGIVSNAATKPDALSILAHHAEQRGRDSSGLVVARGANYEVQRADFEIRKLLKKITIGDTHLVLGHSRLVTNGLADNQPVVRDGIIVIHNGIVVNYGAIWSKLNKTRELQVDSEVIAAIAADHLDAGGAVEEIGAKVLEECRGTVSCALAVPRLGKLLLFSNNGSLYTGTRNGATAFASESFALNQIGCSDVDQVYDTVILDIPSHEDISIEDHKSRAKNLIPDLVFNSAEEALLVYPQPELKRCTRCILPETMPFIRFDDEGVCNYCHNYKQRNKPKPKEELFKLVEPYRREHGPDCIVPFSGGRDSCYGLHLIVNELKMKPITYTYDWGMVTDLGRRNISRMCAELGVENIIVADDIAKKRDNIAMNLKAWLKSPHLGMVSILTAGDKHFFRHVETIKKQTGIDINLWGTSPLEVTHFKAGFLGIPPDFEEDKVYISDTRKQLRYQKLRFQAMLKSPGYFNSSLWDTLSGEYYRSFMKKSDYFHIFDYWTWEEKLVDQTLAMYDWEKAPDTSTTWRIGDGTAALYNYIYYTVAGFTEHDTFRSNQIREGQLTREEALVRVRDENQPRYPNIKWYLDAIGMDFTEVVTVINSIPRLYEE
ncbi:glucosamine 6-phosphate synthetase [Shimia sp. FJ5]|uniref:glucosamine 6-phosphate synthetase n=1 Tax=Shimia sp. FJ5 TaxID=3079054 RepID=UPI00293DC591|nr:glucosamine 6-phosphate synthetase [Shimia sp. FJ5]MDV4144360.1 glucosamine 6-phosphate synthetase [Shimia sp. FJ5]